MLLLSDQLKALLETLCKHNYPEVPNPPSCRKRASVALIIRIRPAAPSSATPSSAISNDESHNDPNSTSLSKIESFFNHDWVRRGDPELLFIRRASRVGDRWTGHVAFPGGKRESADQHDRAASVRETLEEIGLDLSAKHSLYIGNLPQQVVTTAMGKVPLMVLCPFVYILTCREFPSLQLQPSEVAAVHWVSLRALISPSLRTYESCNISDRLSRQGGWFMRSALHFLLGRMLYPAIHLVPTESIYCSSAKGFIPDERLLNSGVQISQMALEWLSPNYVNPHSTEQPLLLWGLTHGIVMNFLDLLPSHNCRTLWAWPTFSHKDIQLFLWLITYHFRQQRRRNLSTDTTPPTRIIEEGLATEVERHRKDRVTVVCSPHKPSGSSVTSQMLDGYYVLVKKALLVTFLFRLSAGSALATLLLKKLRRKL